MLSIQDVNPTIAVKDLKRSEQFYEKVLGLQRTENSNDFVHFYPAGKVTIEVYVSDFAGTNKATSLTWAVNDIEQEVGSLKEKGVEFEHYNMPDTKLIGDIHVMKGMKAAWFKDPDGNVL